MAFLPAGVRMPASAGPKDHSQGRNPQGRVHVAAPPGAAACALPPNPVPCQRGGAGSKDPLIRLEPGQGFSRTKCPGADRAQFRP